MVSGGAGWSGRLVRLPECLFRLAITTRAMTNATTPVPIPTPIASAGSLNASPALRRLCRPLRLHLQYRRLTGRADGAGADERRATRPDDWDFVSLMLNLNSNRGTVNLAYQSPARASDKDHIEH